MEKLYSNLDLLAAERQRRKILLGFWIVTGIFLLGFSALTAFYCLLPYGSKNGTYIIVGTSVLTAIYIFFCFPYMGISYRRVKSYCKAMRYLSEGLKEYAVLPFEGVEDWTTRDGMDVNVADFTIRDPKRETAMVRRIFVDGEKDFPPFREGDCVKLISQGNLLIAYEIENNVKE